MLQLASLLMLPLQLSLPLLLMLAVSLWHCREASCSSIMSAHVIFAGTGKGMLSKVSFSLACRNHRSMEAWLQSVWQRCMAVMGWGTGGRNFAAAFSSWLTGCPNEVNVVAADEFIWSFCIKTKKKQDSMLFADFRASDHAIRYERSKRWRSEYQQSKICRLYNITCRRSYGSTSFTHSWPSKT